MTNARDLLSADTQDACIGLSAADTATEGYEQDPEGQGRERVALTDQEREMVALAFTWKAQVYGVMRQRGYNLSLIEDAFQSACLKCRTVKVPEAMRSTVFLATSQEIKDRLEREPGFKRLLNSLKNGKSGTMPFWFAPFVDSDPEKSINQKSGMPGHISELYGSVLPSEKISTLPMQIDEVLVKLPKLYRRVLVAKVAFETDEEAAQALGMTRPRYKSLLYRARRDARRAAGME